VSKFNSAARAASVRKHPSATRNFEDGLAFEMDAKTRLYSRAVTSLFGEDKFYQSGEDHDQEILNDIAGVAAKDPEFILRLAAYARNEMYLRSVPVVLLAEAAAIPECKPYVRKWASNILRRADEPGEVVAYWLSRFGSKAKFPSSLKKGISDALNRFDEYQLEKYNNTSGTVKTKDVLRIAHPEPKDAKQNVLYRYLRYGELNQELLPKIALKKNFLRKKELDAEALDMMQRGSITWEVAISKFGNRKEVWEALDLPFMAMLRNLRNMLNAGANMKPVIEKLTDKEAVRKSKQFPFRFYSAYRELQEVDGSDRILAALSKAITYSIDNLPTLPGMTLIACDNSGSMESRLSRRGSVAYRDIANLFGALSYGFCENAVVGAFGTDWARVQLNPADSVFTNMERIWRADTKGMATNGYRVIKYLLDKGINVDRIIFLSDMQCYDSRGWGWVAGREYYETTVAEMFQKYRSSINPNVFLHSVDLAGYGTVQVPQDTPNVSLIAGWSDRIFQFIPAFEADKVTAIKHIENYGG